MTETEVRQFTPQQVLDLPLDPGNDSGETTVRGYLVKLLATVWREGEDFSGKRPFGSSGWHSDLYLPLVKAGFVKGELRGAYLSDCDDDAADKAIADAIESLRTAVPITITPTGDAANYSRSHEAAGAGQVIINQPVTGDSAAYHTEAERHPQAATG